MSNHTCICKKKEQKILNAVCLSFFSLCHPLRLCLTAWWTLWRMCSTSWSSTCSSCSSSLWWPFSSSRAASFTALMSPKSLSATAGQPLMLLNRLALNSEAMFVQGRVQVSKSGKCANQQWNTCQELVVSKIKWVIRAQILRVCWLSSKCTS